MTGAGSWRDACVLQGAKRHASGAEREQKRRWRNESVPLRTVTVGERNEPEAFKDERRSEARSWKRRTYGVRTRSATSGLIVRKCLRFQV
jgi:hypothetical protein